VVRREANSLTMVDATGSTHTFLYGELADIRYGTASAGGETPGSQTAASASQVADSAASKTDPPASTGTPAGDIVFPAGTEFSVVTSGFLDSCCVPIGAFSVGTLDADVKSGGKVVVPRGANVTIVLADQKITDGRISMRFELGSADFGGHHYLIASRKGGLEPGAVVTYTGEKEGTPEAKLRGTNVHLDDHDLMIFKAASATGFTLSQ
jgi:hypothetical protein